jgi:hypothetical protein
LIYGNNRRGSVFGVKNMRRCTPSGTGRRNKGHFGNYLNVKI